MQTVYALSDKGQQESSNAQPTLPAELSDLLRLVDGRRTKADLLAAARGRSAVVAGGLRWLKASGYILASDLPGHSRMAAPEAQVSQPVTMPDLQPADSQHDAVSTRPQLAAPNHARAEGDTRRILSDFMLQSIRRRLGDAGYASRHHIERATSVRELLPHLNPLIDAIVARVGADAGAEFADTAAFILKPRDRDATLS